MTVTIDRDPTLEAIRARIARGAALLDRVGPDGWRNWINLTTLDLGNPRLCVLGQTYGEEAADNFVGDEQIYYYYYGLDVLNLTCAEAVEHGFDVFANVDYNVSRYVSRYGMEAAEYAALTEAWREYLRESRTPV